MHLTIPIAPEMEITATAQVAALGEWMEMGRDKIDEVKMAVVEACINAFEHSYTPDRKVEIDFRIGVEDAGQRRSYLEVDVTDAGKGLRPVARGDAEPAGQAEGRPEAGLGDQDHREPDGRRPDRERRARHAHHHEEVPLTGSSRERRP